MPYTQIKNPEQQDPLDRVAKVLSIQKMLADAAEDPLRRELLQQQLETSKATQLSEQQQQVQRAYAVEQQKHELIVRSIKYAATGDIKGANDIYRVANPNAVLERHDNVGKRNRGIFYKKDLVTGERTELDPWAEMKLDENVRLQADLIRRAKDFDLHDAQHMSEAIRTTALSLVNQEKVPDLRTGLILAKQLMEETRNFNSPSRPLPFPKADPGEMVQHPKVGDLPPGLLENRLEAYTQLDAARQMNGDVLATRLSTTLPSGKEHKMSSEEMKRLSGLLGSNKIMAEQLIPTFVELDKTITANPNFANAQIQDILSNVGWGDKRFLALRTLMGRNLFGELLNLSGTAYSDKQYAGMAPLYPNASDTVSQALAKMSALMSINSVNANSIISVQKAAGVQTGDMESLFVGRDYVGKLNTKIGTDTALTLLNALPDSIKQDEAAMEMFVGNLSPVVRDAVDEELSSRGTPTQRGIKNRFRKAMGK